MSAGGLLGGILIDSFGITRMYLYVGLIVLTATIIFVFLQNRFGQSYVKSL
jgi:hypothetical protein